MDFKEAHDRSSARIAALDDPSGLVQQMMITSEVISLQSRGNGFAYPSYYEMVLQLGTEKHTDDFYVPDEVTVIPQARACYLNAALVVLEDPEEYTYCEGYATTDDIGICMSHAWVEDSQGNVIDPTWADIGKKRGATYYGIKFDRNYLRERWIKQGDYFGGLLGECYGYTEHVQHGVLVEDGVVMGEKEPVGVWPNA